MLKSAPLLDTLTLGALETFVVVVVDSKKIGISNGTNIYGRETPTDVFDVRVKGEHSNRKTEPKPN